MFEISLAPTLVPLGGLVTVQGTLSGEDGTPIPDARVVVRLDGKESADSLVLTGPQGAFQTFAEIPDDQPAGKADLVVVFAGNDAYAPGERAVTVTVEELPLAEDTKDSAKATGTVSAEASATNTTTPTTVSTGDAGTTTDTAGGRSPLSWFYVALIVVGGVALLVAAALAFRTMYGQRDATLRDTGGLERLLDVDPDADADADGGGLLGDPAEEENLPSSADGQSAGQPPQAEPGENLHPRRRAD
ncbi:carboxypeptidase regulatory-like domain-containing protein [Tessaracoccus antarcticus]|uniref:Carboxypeptidase regulatory-like domain-containing protein n=2 Tax=Tessaracoccus antarcticus TaxID=2479848 RepID=A0A3M0G9Z8_9ACTN|nr:carboxypeptidase regulatory-like domain-containing protein [Tessaracoccus antarcticus]